MSDLIEDFKDKLNREFAEAAANSVTIPHARYEAYEKAAKDIGWLITFIDNDENWERIRETHAALRAAGVIEDI